MYLREKYKRDEFETDNIDDFSHYVAIEVRAHAVAITQRQGDIFHKDAATKNESCCYAATDRRITPI